MQNENKRQSPYRGFVVTILILIIPGLLCYITIDAAMLKLSPYPYALNKASSQALGCLFTCFFHIIALLCDLLTPGWEALKFRVIDFFENLIVGVRYAFETYWESMCEDGVTFLIYGSIIAANLWYLVDGISKAVALLP